MATEILSRRSKFYFKGARDYVNGPTVFEAFRQAAMDATGTKRSSLRVKKFIFRQTLVTDALIKVCRGGDIMGRKSGELILAEMSCVLNGDDYFVALFDAGLPAVKKRKGSFEKRFIATARLEAPFAGICELTRIKTNYDLVQAVMEANKQIILLSLPERANGMIYKFKFVYCVDYMCPETVTDSEGLVTVKNIAVCDYDGYRYFLNRLDVELGNSKTSFQICFGSKCILDLAPNL